MTGSYISQLESGARRAPRPKVIKRLCKALGVPERRLQDLQSWLEPFRPLQYAVESALDLVRESAAPEREVAEDGIYKRSLDTKSPCQLIIVSLPVNTAYFAEFSGSRHRFTVRFIDATQKHPTQANNNVEFDLSCCKL